MLAYILIHRYIIYYPQGGRTALMHAVIEDHFDAVDLLTSRGADRQLALQVSTHNPNG